MCILSDGPNDRLPENFWVAAFAGLTIFGGPLLLVYVITTYFGGGM